MDRWEIYLDAELTGLDVMRIENQSKGGVKNDCFGFGLRCWG